jgi:ribosomal protein L37AE/L43A
MSEQKECECCDAPARVKDATGMWLCNHHFAGVPAAKADHANRLARDR